MGKIRGRDYISWLWQYTAPMRAGLVCCYCLGCWRLLPRWPWCRSPRRIIDHATVGSGFRTAAYGLCAAVIGNAGNLGVVDTATALVTERFSFGIRRQIYEKILHSGWREVTAYHTGDLMTRLTSDAGNVADGIVGTIPNILQLGIELVPSVLYVVLLFPAPCGVCPTGGTGGSPVLLVAGKTPETVTAESAGE